MRTAIKSIFIGIVISAAVGQAFAYPPDNAAVLYDKAFLLKEEPNDVLGKILAAVGNDEAKPDDQVRQYVERNRRVIKYVVAAADIGHCDWGYDLSEGAGLRMPEVGKCRRMAYLLTADAKILAEKGDYKEALERCITIHKMSIHVGDDTVIQVAVSRAIGGLANKCIVDIMPQVYVNRETLERLRTQLADIYSRVPSMKAAIVNEDKYCSLNSADKKELLELVHSSDLSREDRDKAERIIRQHDDNEFYVKTAEYHKSVLSKVEIAYDLPYPQTKKTLDDLQEEVKNAAKEKPEAIITGVVLPMIDFLTIDTKNRTQFNAVLGGLDIYLIKAKTGKLPDELPAGLPKDLFSGKDFLYEKTDAGFALTGQGKDLDKNIVQKYEFKVTK
jgi:hypothetical protein